MNYLKAKYQGYYQVDTGRLKDELLMSATEYKNIRKDIAHTLGKTQCPGSLDIDTFCDIVEAYLS